MGKWGKIVIEIYFSWGVDIYGCALPLKQQPSKIVIYRVAVCRTNVVQQHSNLPQMPVLLE